MRSFLDLAGRADIPVAAGAGASLTTGGPMGVLPDHRRSWGSVPEPVWCHASTYGPALDLLRRSVDAGATIVSLGPPAWGPARDTNVGHDTAAVMTVASTAALTLTGFDVTLRAHPRAADIA